MFAGLKRRQSYTLSHKGIGTSNLIYGISKSILLKSFVRGGFFFSSKINHLKKTVIVFASAKIARSFSSCGTLYASCI